MPHVTTYPAIILGVDRIPEDIRRVVHAHSAVPRILGGRIGRTGAWWVLGQPTGTTNYAIWKVGSDVNGHPIAAEQVSATVPWGPARELLRLNAFPAFRVYVTREDQWWSATPDAFLDVARLARLTDGHGPVNLDVAAKRLKNRPVTVRVTRAAGSRAYHTSTLDMVFAVDRWDAADWADAARTVRRARGEMIE